jgi:hypothetical protein
LVAASHYTGGAFEPKPGDLSICFDCGAINQFAEDMSFKTCPPDVLEEMKPNDRSFVLQAVRSVKQRHRPS